MTEAHAFLRGVVYGLVYATSLALASILTLLWFASIIPCALGFALYGRLNRRNQ